MLMKWDRAVHGCDVACSDVTPFLSLGGSDLDTAFMLGALFSKHPRAIEEKMAR